MTAVFILDDCRRNATQLALGLQSASSGQLSCVVLEDLSHFRQISRHYKRGVVLVELVRQQGNGFELAAALSRQTRFPVVLLSAREQPADEAWALARGIRHVFDRRQGIAQLQSVVNRLLDGTLPEPPHRSSLELPRCPVLPHAVTAFEQWCSPGCEGACDASTPAVLPDDAASARQALLRLCATLWSELVSDLDSDDTLLLPPRLMPRWNELCALLVFLQEAAPAPDLNGVMSLGIVLRANNLDSTSETDVRGLVMAVCQQALRAAPDKAAGHRLMLAQLALTIRLLRWAEHDDAITRLCIALEQELIPGLYDPPRTGSKTTLCLSPPSRWQDVIKETFDSVAEPWLAPSTHWHVSLYKLRSWLECRAETCAHAQIHDDLTRNAPGFASWFRCINLMYRVFAHLQIPQLPGATQWPIPVELTDVLKEVCALIAQPCFAQEGLALPESVISRLMALDLGFALADDREQRTAQTSLASGLKLLARPEKLVALLWVDNQSAGTLLAELLHELSLLLEGARRWQVVGVESLVTLLILCYRRIRQHAEWLEHRSWRLALGRAHRQLCRMLDQAAAWQAPVKNSGAKDRGSAQLARVMNDLFGLLNPKLASSFLLSGIPHGHTQQSWLDCLSLNRRLKQLVELQRTEHIDNAMLILSLISEQHAHIQQQIAGTHTV